MEKNKNLKLLNPDYKIILWVQQIKSVNSDGEMIRRAKEVGVHVIDMRDVFAGNTPIWQEHMIAFLKAKYGMVCDIDRPIFLRYGGVNPDTDDDLLKSYGTLAPIHGIYLQRYNGKATAVNTAITPKHPFMEAAATGLKQGYQKPFGDVVKGISAGFMQGSFAYDKFFYKLNLYNPTSKTVDLPLAKFNEAYTLSLVQQVDVRYTAEDFYPDANFYIINRGLSWIETTQNFEGDHLLAIKQILTCILHDLQKEPRCLYIDQYHGPCNEYGIGNIVLKLLLDYFPDTLKQVEYLRITRTCDDTKLIQEVFSPNNHYFPNLKHNLHFLKQLVLTDFNYTFVQFLVDNKSTFQIDEKLLE